MVPLGIRSPGVHFCSSVKEVVRTWKQAQWHSNAPHRLALMRPFSYAIASMQDLLSLLTHTMAEWHTKSHTHTYRTVDARKNTRQIDNEEHSHIHIFCSKRHNDQNTWAPLTDATHDMAPLRDATQRCTGAAGGRLCSSAASSAGRPSKRQTEIHTAPLLLAQASSQAV